MITVEEILASEHPMSLDDDYDGACPCFHLKGEGFKVDGHCWRTCMHCEYAGIHITGLDLEITMQVGIHIATHNGWNSWDDQKQTIQRLGVTTFVEGGHTDWTITKDYHV